MSFAGSHSKRSEESAFFLFGWRTPRFVKVMRFFLFSSPAENAQLITENRVQFSVLMNLERDTWNHSPRP